MLFPRIFLAVAGMAAASAGAPSPAEAQQVPLDLQRHCTAKYQPRGIQATAEPIRWTQYGPQLLCRLVRGGSPGYTLDNQSPEEACRSQTGSPSWTAQSPYIYCGGASAGPAPNQPRPPRTCLRTAAGFVCR